MDRRFFRAAGFLVMLASVLSISATTEDLASDFAWLQYTIREAKSPLAEWYSVSVLQKESRTDTKGADLRLLEAAARKAITSKPPAVHRITLKNGATHDGFVSDLPGQVKLVRLPSGEPLTFDPVEIARRDELPAVDSARLVAEQLLRSNSDPIAVLETLGARLLASDNDPKVAAALEKTGKEAIKLVFAACSVCAARGETPCGNADCDKGKTLSQTECHKCKGHHDIDCPTCGGSGAVKCIQCKGDGRVDRGRVPTRCLTCGGDGKIGCSKCGGRQKIVCFVCKGTGQKSERVNCPTCSGSRKATCAACDGQRRREAMKPDIRKAAEAAAAAQSRR